MSWLNLNDSFNNLKGQLTNLANNVLSDSQTADGNSSSSGGSDLEQLKQLCVSQQVEIARLKSINEELTVTQKLANVSLNNNDVDGDGDNGGRDDESSSSNWSWVIPEKNDNKTTTTTNVCDLEKKIKDLENDKRDLIKNLELLDNDYQVNQEKLISIKDKLQDDYNKLEVDYDDLKLKYDELLHDKECNKCENLIKQNQDLSIEIDRLKDDNKILTSNNQTLTKILDDPKNNNELERIKEKLKQTESENKNLLNEIEKLTESVKRYEKQREIDAENFQKLSSILEGYELKVQSLKDELEQTRRDYRIENNNQRQIVEFQEQVENLQCQLQNSCKETHQRYVNFLCKIIKNIEKDYENFDLNNSNNNNNNNDDELMNEFINQINQIIKIIVNLKQRNQNLEKDVFNVTQEKTNLLQEKNHEIEKLLQNSEILSQEVLTKTQTIQDYEHECNELIKNNDLLINELENYKNNLNNSNNSNNGGLQTISETNEDNLLLLETQLDNANRKIEELEKLIAQQQNTIIEENINEELTKNLEKLTCENGELKTNLVEVKDENAKLCNLLEKIKLDLENTEYQYTELNVNHDSLKEEIENQKNHIDELVASITNLKKSNTELEHINENYRSELNEIREKLLIEEDERRQLENQIRNLSVKLQDSEKGEIGLKLQYDTTNKELSNLLETNALLQNKTQQLEHELEQYRNHDENSQIVEEERDRLLKEIEELKENEQRQRQQINELETTKAELTNVILKKHEENVTYHNEIQRLSQILTVELEKTRNYEIEIQQLKDNTINNDVIEKLTDQNNFLREKCEILTKNLLDEQNDKQQICKNFNEKEQNLNKNLERLQAHLIEIEEHYTQELLLAEEKNAELQNKVSEIEEREKNSSTIYTSVSIRANQHVETLQNQLQMITNQRDELRKKISEFEDNASKQAAALANLQFVLEQFQKERENDIFKETERIRRQITAEKKIQDELRNEIINLQLQLDESKQGLLAASRLSDQLEQSKQIVTNLKGEVSRLKEELSKSEEKLKQLSSNTDGKVDKSLIKNLIIGFISSNNNLNKDQMQIVKIIATVLDFNQQDYDKINLNKNQQWGSGWLSSLLTPQQSTQEMSQESLSLAFVRFLEKESKPRVVPSLLNDNDEIVKSRKNSTARQSPIVLSEVVLPTFADFAQNRNSSSILKDVLKDAS